MTKFTDDKENSWFLFLTLPLLALTYATILPDMAAQWGDDPNYSHGYLVPLISAWFLWQRKDDLRAAPIQPAHTGLAVVLLGLLMLVAGIAGTEYFTMRASFIVVLTGIVLYWYGWEVLKIAALPLAFLLFMVPLPYIVYDAIAFPMKLFVAKFSVAALQGMGVLVWREGNIIQFPNVVLEVADACSGLRSIMSLGAFTVAYSFLFLRAPLQRLIVILFAIPCAIAANMVRVIGTGLLAQHYGEAAAEGFFHEFAGLGVFILAVAMIFLAGMLVRRVGA